MSDENDLELKFGADTSGVAAGTAAVQGSVGELQGSIAGLSAAMAAQTAAITEGFAAMAAASESTKVAIVKDIEEEEVSLLGLVKSVHEGVESFVAFKAGLGEIAEVYAAAFAVEKVVEFVKSMGEAAEQTQHTAQAFGMTTAEVQELQGRFTLAGASAGALTTTMTRLDRAASEAVSGQKRAGDAFKLLGVNINEPMTPAERLKETLAGFANIPGPDRAAVAMGIFGRSIQQIAPLLGLTKEQLDEANESLERFGIVNTDAQEKGAALGGALNENKAAMTGLMEVLTQALAPAFTTIVEGIDTLVASFIKSYQSGGLARQIMDALASAIKGLETVFVAVGLVIAEFSDIVTGVFTSIRDVVSSVVNAVIGWLKAMDNDLGGVGRAFKNIADIAVSALSTVIGWVEKAAVAVNKFLSSLPIVGPTFTKVGADVSATMAKMVDDAQNAAKAFQAIWSDKREGSPGTLATKPPKIGGTDKKGKKDPSQMGEFQEEFAQQQVDWENTHPGQLQDQLTAELNFWKGILDSGRATGKDLTEVTKNYYNARHQLRQQDIEETVEASKAATANEISEINTTLKAQIDAIGQEIKAVQDKANQHVISRTQERQQVDALIQQEIDAEVAAAQAIARARIAGDDTIMSHYAATDPVYKAALADRVTAEIAAQNTITLANAKGAAQIQAANRTTADAAMKDWETSLKPIVSSFGSMVTGLVEGTKTFSQIWAQFGESLLNAFIGWAEHMIVVWAAKELTQTAASTAGNATRVAVQVSADQTATASSAAASIAQIGQAAAVAAGRAWAALEALPGGVFIAPAVAAATLAGVLALGKTIFSSAGGMEAVPYDGAMFQLHKDETVLPADIAVPLRSAVKGFGAGSTAGGLLSAATGGPGGAGGQDAGGVAVHIHAMDAKSVRRLFMEHGDALGDAIRAQARNLRFS